MSQIILYDGEQIIHVSRVNRNHANADGAKLGLPERVRVLLAENPGTRAIVIEDGVKARTHHVVQDGGVLHVKRLDVPSDIAKRLADAARRARSTPQPAVSFVHQTVPTEGTILRRPKTITLFTPFAAAWTVPYYLASLDALAIPDGWSVEVLWYDNTNDERASGALRAYMSETNRWDDVRYHVDQTQAALDADRTAVAGRMVSIYSEWLTPRVSTELLFTWEHDVLLQPDTLCRCLEVMGERDAIAVGACVWDRRQQRPLAWCIESGQRTRIRWAEDGEDVQGVSFSATLFRASDVARFPLRPAPAAKGSWLGADLALMCDFAKAGLRVDVLWDHICPHMLDAQNTVPPSELPAPHDMPALPQTAGPLRHYLKGAVATEPTAAGKGIEGMVSISLVTYNDPATVRQCVSSVLANTTIPFELLIWDNGSPQATRDYLESVLDYRVRAFLSPTNVNYIGGHNALALAARGEFFCVLNDDVRVEQGWLAALFAGLAHPGVGQAVPPQDHGALDAAGQGIGREPNQPPEYAEGWCFLTRTKWAQAFGPFDAKQYEAIYCEDSDLSLRMRSTGLTIAACPDARVYHEHGKSKQLNPETKIRLEAFESRNKAAFRDRWGRYLSSNARRLEPGVVCISRPISAGDILMTLGAIQSVRSTFGAAKLWYGCASCHADILRGCPWIDRVVETPGFDPRQFRSQLGTGRHTDIIDPKTGASVAHQISAVIDMTWRYARDPVTSRPDLFCDAAGVARVRPRYWQQHPRRHYAETTKPVVLTHFASHSPNRQPSHDWAREVSRTLKATGLYVVGLEWMSSPLGEPDETLRLDWWDMVAAVAGADVILCTDSAIAHVAQTLGKRCVLVHCSSEATPNAYGAATVALKGDCAYGPCLAGTAIHACAISATADPAAACLDTIRPELVA